MHEYITNKRFSIYCVYHDVILFPFKVDIKMSAGYNLAYLRLIDGRATPSIEYIWACRI
jgi:hypothetical protein